jgi:hypothetical protein
MPSLLGEIPPELRVPMPLHPSPEGATYPRIGPWSYPEAPPPAPVLNQLIQDGGEAGYAILVRGDSSGITCPDASASQPRRGDISQDRTLVLS